MSIESENNKRIAKNTVFLYLRMILVMGVGLYTSRLILQILGVSDYGIYNVMGGIIGMLAYVNTLMSGATSRFLTIDLGKGDMLNLKRTFSMSSTLCLASAAIFLILGETIGLWFMNTHLNIAPERLYAANWVYQCALLSAAVTVIQSPYLASVIANEKMSAYAYMSIFDVCMKFLAVFALQYFDSDKLILYGIFLLAVNILNALIYRIYCRKKFPECTFSFYFSKSKFMEMFSYSGWNMIIVFANVLNNYGLNILLNIFYGTVVNAARGLALQVNSIVSQFYSNFQTASRPQIMKYYAQGNIQEMSKLIRNTSKISAFLLMCLIIPISFNIDALLDIWLDEVPQYTSWFVVFMMLNALCAAVDYPVGMGIQAVGKMKLPNLTVSLLYLSIFPIGYLAMKLGAGPVVSYAVYIAIAPIILLADMLILKKYTGFSIGLFLKEVVLPIFFVLAVSLIVPAILSFVHIPDSFWSTLLAVAVDALYVCLVIFFIGLPKSLRDKMLGKLFGKGVLIG